MSTQNPHLAYRRDIDGLRAVAVLSVVIFHAFPSALPGGFIGVDIFFVISGYLISGIIIRGLENESFSLREFYARRIKRIFPTLILVLLACMLIGWFVLQASEYKALARQTLWGAGFAGNLLMKKEAGYFDTAAELKPLLHLWSLGVEEQFYLIWPVLLIVASRFKINLVWLITLLLAVSFGLNAALINIQPDSVFYSPHTRFWELWAGALLAWIDRQTPSQRKNWFDELCAWSGALLLLAALLFVDKNKAFPGMYALLPVVGAFLLIRAGENTRFNHAILGCRPLVAVGLISYPLYLWHWPLLAFGRIVEHGNPSHEVRLGAVILSIALAWLSYIGIEKHLRFHKRRIVTILLVVTLLAVAIAAEYIKRGQGIPWRKAELLAVPHIEDQDSFFRELSTHYPPCSPAELEAKALRHNGFVRCRQSEAGNRPQTVALIGDSHAEHLFPGLAHYGYPKDNLVYYSYPCLPFWGLTGASDCAEMEDVLKYVIEQPNIHTIVLANLWEARWNDARYTLSAVPLEEDRKKIFSTALKLTLKKLEAAGKQVVFVFDVPNLGFLPEACQTRPFSLQQSALSPCAVSREETQRRQNDYRQLVMQALHDFPNVAIWDPVAVLCNTEWCMAAENDLALYRDENHLSSWASYRLGQKYAPRKLMKYSKQD